MNYLHWVKSVQIRSYFWSVFSCIWTEFGLNTDFITCLSLQEETTDVNILTDDAIIQNGAPKLKKLLLIHLTRNAFYIWFSLTMEVNHMKALLSETENRIKISCFLYHLLWLCAIVYRISIFAQKILTSAKYWETGN